MADLTLGYVSALVPGVEPKVLYGGSVRPENVLEYISLPSIDGVLIGGASTKAESLEAILKAMKA
jgi:triosephosphate isomerase